MSLSQATSGFNRHEALRELAKRLASEIDECTDQRNLASLSRQYRETMAEIEAIDSGENDENEIAAIILRHRQSGADEHGGAE